MTGNASARAAFGLALILSGAAAAAAPVRLDSFEDVGQWSAHPADGVRLELGQGPGVEGRALRLDFGFTGGGYAVARKTFAIDLPEDYAFSFRIRGEAPANHLEFKLLDASGENVWWCVRRDFAFPREWQRVRIRKRHISFAWGPAGGGEIRQVAAIEIVVTAGSGGAGTVWIDELELEALPVLGTEPSAPLARASTSRDGRTAALALDGDSTTAWWSRAESHPWLAVEHPGPREFGGMTVHWVSGRHARDYVLETSDDGRTWTTLRTVRGGNGGRDDLYLPESEARSVRLRVLTSAARDGIAIHEIVVRPLEWSASRNAFFTAIAAESHRGLYPRAMSGEQSYWTVVGVDADPREALFDEDGRLDIATGRGSIEPFLYRDRRLVGWAAMASLPSLVGGALPIPRVQLRHDGLALTVTAFGDGPPGASAVVARYELVNESARRAMGTLFLAVRPFQVNPPAQFLNGAGGWVPIRSLETRGGSLLLNGELAAVCLGSTPRFGATSFAAGDVVADHLRRGRLPEATRVEDDFEAASGAWSLPFDLAPGEATHANLWVPLHAGAAAPAITNEAAARDWVAERLAAAEQAWTSRTNRVELRLPAAAAPLVESLRSQLGWILVNRAGPAIQPGARAYARSWIRDGTLTSTALLRLGHADAAREFLEWFAPHQYPNGKVPCVVDRRGADPVPEHDSSGEFIHLVAEVYRYTGDRTLLERHFPRVLAAVDYLDSLRHERRTPEFQSPDQRHLFGLLPPSISHEGYSAKPMHSYWDDFWAVRGFRDAAFLAAALGRETDHARIESLGAEFERDVAASIAAALARHGIDYVPGCADLGDFDATSTTIALSPTGASSLLPPAALRRTFDKYLEFFRARAAGEPWEAFTPYEIRNVGACLRLGWRDEAHELLRFFVEMQRPPGFRQWPEVVWRESRVPHFLGDSPHTWVGSDYVRSFLDGFAYERESDESLVLGAGVRRDWLRPPGISVHGLRTPYGPLTYEMQQDGAVIVVRIEAGLRLPPGGLVVQAPVERSPSAATIDARPAPLEPDGSIVVRALPAVVVVTP